VKFETAKCKRCGKCCQTYIILAKEKPDVKTMRLMKWRGIEVRRVGDEFVVIIPTKPCKHLKKNGECGIYDKRPVNCDYFPLHRDVIDGCIFNKKEVKV